MINVVVYRRKEKTTPGLETNFFLGDLENEG